MKIFTGGIVAETNTFAPFPTGASAFESGLLFRRGESVAEPHQMDLCRVYIESARALGWEVAAGLRAMPGGGGGVVPQPLYEQLRDELLDDLRASLPVDAVLLGLHGAMVAADEHDCEGDIIERMRGIVGPSVPIGVHHDPHSHLTARMVDNADVIRIWKYYPHTDVAERAREVFDMIRARLEGKPRAIPVLVSVPMTQMLHTTREPMRSFVDKITSIEGRHGIQSISVSHSFPWGDVPSLGTRILVYADDEQSLPRAERAAATLGEELWNAREACSIPLLSIDEALDQGFGSTTGPAIIADGSDNPGGGAPGDSTYILARLIDREERDWALGLLNDAVALRIATDAGVGSRIRLRVGGKVCELSGQPVDIDATVRAVGRHVHQRLGSLVQEIGDAVALDLGDNRDLVIIGEQVQTASHEVFGELGIDLVEKRVVVVKSAQHFIESFSQVSESILYCAAPGVVSPDLSSLPYRHADVTLWPIARSDADA